MRMRVSAASSEQPSPSATRTTPEPVTAATRASKSRLPVAMRTIGWSPEARSASTAVTIWPRAWSGLPTTSSTVAPCGPPTVCIMRAPPRAEETASITSRWSPDWSTEVTSTAAAEFTFSLTVCVLSDAPGWAHACGPGSDSRDESRESVSHGSFSANNCESPYIPDATADTSRVPL